MYKQCIKTIKGHFRFRTNGAIVHLFCGGQLIYTDQYWVKLTSQVSISDVELMQQIAQKDQAALSGLYGRYGSLVYSLALRVLQNTQLAEEVTQDTFLDVWHHPDKWDASKGQLSSWLLTVTRYTAIDRLRKTLRRPETDLDEARTVTENDWIHDPLWQDGQLLRSLLVKLPIDQRQLIEMAFFGGMTHSELAAASNLPLGTVKTRVRMGLQKLKGLWQESTKE